MMILIVSGTAALSLLRLQTTRPVTLDVPVDGAAALSRLRATRATGPAMLDVAVDDQVRVAGTDSYPKFFHVPGNKEGLVAKGMVGTVVKVYKPDSSDTNLDRSDGRDVLVEFQEPKKWRAHFSLEELTSPDVELPQVDVAVGSGYALASEIELCTIDSAQPCDRVEEFMTPILEAVTFAPEMPMTEAAKLLLSSRITGAPVVNAEGHLVGVLTQFDFLYREHASAVSGALDSGKWDKIVKKSLGKTVAAAMSKPTAITASADMQQVAQLMLQRRFNHLPVVEDGGGATLVGILTSQDVLRHVLLRM